MVDWGQDRGGMGVKGSGVGAHFLKGPVVTQPPPSAGGIMLYGAGAPGMGMPWCACLAPLPLMLPSLPSKRGELAGSLA